MFPLILDMIGECAHWQLVFADMRAIVKTDPHFARIWPGKGI